LGSVAIVVRNAKAVIHSVVVVASLTACTTSGVESTSRSDGSLVSANQVQTSDHTGASTATVFGEGLESPKSQTSLQTIANLTTSEEILVFNAQQRLIERCMAERGYDYTALAAEAPTVRFTTIPSAEEIERHGYLYVSARFAEVAQTAAPDPQLSPEQLGALESGSSGPGCAESSARELGYEEFGTVSSTILNAYTEHQVRARSDPRYLDVLNLWSVCLEGFGYRAEDTEQIVEAAEEFPGGLAGEEARTLAIRDYACRTSSGLSDVAEQIQFELDAIWIEENPGTVDAINSAKTGLLERATQVLD
jgi:hypothetical protein